MKDGEIQTPPGEMGDGSPLDFIFPGELDETPLAEWEEYVRVYGPDGPVEDQW